jgi:elongation factor G
MATSANGKPETQRAAAGGSRGSRCIALIGPYLSGKTTLLEAILERTGAVARAGTIAGKSTVGDGSAEARDHGMSVQLNVAEASFLGDTFTFVDCPGSIEFQSEGAIALTACDAAIVVCEPDPKRVPALQVILKSLEDRGIPHFLFLNKIDTFTTHVRDIIPVLQPASTRPLVLRQIPIWENGIATGFVDLASERAYVYREHAPSEIVELPASIVDREKEARFHMLEQLADYDDGLMEQLLSDLPPPKDKIFDDLAAELRAGQICPVLLGSAANANGIMRLMKALRHEVPFVETTAQRLKIENAKSAAFILKTMHTAHGGKLSVARVLTGAIADGATITAPNGKENRIAGEGRRPRCARPPRRRPHGRHRHGGARQRGAGQAAREAAAGVRPGAYSAGSQGRGEAVGGAGQARRGRPFAHHRAQPGYASGAAARPGRDAPARGTRAADAQVPAGGGE